MDLGTIFNFFITIFFLKKKTLLLKVQVKMV